MLFDSTYIEVFHASDIDNASIHLPTPTNHQTGGEGYNKVPVAFGIFKLVISMVVFDDEVRFFFVLTVYMVINRMG